MNEDESFASIWWCEGIPIRKLSQQVLVSECKLSLQVLVSEWNCVSRDQEN